MFRNITYFFLYMMCVSAGYAQKNRIFQHKEIKKYISAHKTIAILPFKVLKEQGGQRSEDSLSYSLKQEAQRESENIPFTCALLWAGKAQVNSPQLLALEKTRKILQEMRYTPAENILTDTLRKIAQLLKADALICGIVNGYEDKYATNFGKTHFASEEIVTIYVSIYDGATGTLLWYQEDSTAYSLRLEEKVSLAKNTEIVLTRIFENLPYFKKQKQRKKK